MSEVLDSLHPSLRELPGKTIVGRYRVDEALGVGGMGAVFRGRHLGLKRDVAIKVLHPDLTRDPEISKRFDREAHSASRLDHPNCLRVTDVGSTEDGVKFMVMDLLSGSELADRLGSPIPAERAVLMVLQILRGLEHAHDHGVVHRDVKPENIFITRDHEGREVLKLVDFGIAKLAGGNTNDTRMTKAGLIFGTPAYMSPEQAMGMDSDARADLYAVGVILYEMLAGTPPFESDDPVKLVRMQVSREPPPLPDHVPPALSAVVMKLLAKDRDDRFQSAVEARESLEQVLPMVVTGDVVSGVTLYGSRTSGQFMVAHGSGAIAVGASSSVSAPISVMPMSPERGSGTFPPAVLPTLPPGSGMLQLRPHDRRLPLIGAAALAVVVLGVWIFGDSDEGGAAGQDATIAVGGADEAPTPALDGADDEPAELLIEDGPDEARLAEVDRMIFADKLGEAQQLLQPLLDEYPHNAMLAWRQGRIFAKSKKTGARSKALASYGDAVDADPTLLDDHDFYAELHALLVNPKLRTEALNFALRKMGRTGHKFLLELVNEEDKPLSYNDRRRALQELATLDENDALVNWELHRALDILQAATQALTPCTAYRDALDAIAASPDYWFLARVLRADLPVPKVGKGVSEEEMADGAQCEGLEARRAEVIVELEKLAPVEATTGGDEEIIIDDGEPAPAGSDAGAKPAKKSSGGSSGGSKPSGKSGCNKPFGWIKKQCR
jgi:tRNA A-37 threonylcarbamoyl transferase component Bud32